MPQRLNIRIRRGTKAEWIAKNPILDSGEPGFEHDTRKIKIGDGVTPWNDLAYIGPDLSSLPTGQVDDQVIRDLIQAHVNSLTPHPVYDDGPSLALLYENRKV